MRHLGCRPQNHAVRKAGWARIAVLLLMALGFLGACSDFPRDPEHTLDHVRHGVMRVGVSHDPHFVVMRADGTPEGREVEVLETYARTLDARIVWIEAGTHDLMAQLERFQIDAVVGGGGHDTPWDERVAFSRPYLVTAPSEVPESRRLALPPGENAWAMAFDRYTSRRATLPAAADAEVLTP